MSDQESIFYKRNQQGEIIINLNSNAFKQLLSWLVVMLLLKPCVGLINMLYTSINVVSARKPVLFLTAGLGLGFGMGLVVFQRPMTTLASPFPVYAQPAAITIDQVQLAGVTFTVQPAGANPLTNLTHLETSAGIHQSGTSVLAVGARHEAKTYLQAASLNDPIQVIGSNNGRYSYRLVEIKEVSHEALPSLFNQNGRTLVIYAPTNLLQTTYVVLIAK